MERVAGNQYLTGLTLYFVGYVLFEVRNILINGMKDLTNTDPMQHHPQIDLSKVMAPDAYTGLGYRSHPPRCHAKHGRFLRRSLRPRHDRKWIVSWGGVLPVHVVQAGRAALSDIALLQCGFSSRGFRRCTRVGKSMALYTVKLGQRGLTICRASPT